MSRPWILFLLMATVSSTDVGPRLRNRNVERTVDLTSQLAKVTVKLTLENFGTAPARNFLVVCEPGHEAAYVGARDSAGRELKVAETDAAKTHRIEPRDQIPAGGSAEFVLELVFAKTLVPRPATVAQKDRQLVVYGGSHYFHSPYPTVSQRTRVLLPNKNVESHSKLKPFSASDSAISYGPYEDVPAFAIDPMTVHFENDSPFLTVTSMTRTVEVSHWGNVAVEETLDVRHSGAPLKGSFSRYEYQQDPSGGPSGVKSYRTLLPASATGVYYRDTNGNISTSHMRIKKDAVELELRPRFPLFGGWKTHYTLGYDVPGYEYLYRSGDRYLLRMRLIDHVFDDMSVDEITTRIILPEGSVDVKLATPYPVERLPDATHHTYLDTAGRPTVAFTKRNLVENHIQDFQLRYTFARVNMLREPLLVVAFLYALFLCVVVYVRLDFSIHKDDHHRE